MILNSEERRRELFNRVDVISLILLDGVQVVAIAILGKKLACAKEVEVGACGAEEVRM